MTAFTRSMRALRANRFRRSGIALGIALILLAAWLSWFMLARVSLYEVTTAARLEVDRAIYPVQSPMLGRVLRTTLVTGRQVTAGEILLELDTSAERLGVQEEETRVSALGPEIAALNSQIESENRAREQERASAAVALEQARIEARQAETPAQFSAAEERRLRKLREQGLIAAREYDRGRAEAEQLRYAADKERTAVRRIEQEQGTREADRESRLRKLKAEIAHLEGQITTSRSRVQTLSNEIEKRTVRAPVSGRLGEAAVLRVGAVLQEGEKVGAIVPDGQMLVVAQFPPPAALGRITAGQRAELRLDGFPWAQWGTVPAVVERVAGEVRDGAIRVELAIDASRTVRVPLQHGLPGTIEVEVEQITPADFLARVAGRMLRSPRPAFRSGE